MSDEWAMTFIFGNQQYSSMGYRLLMSLIIDILGRWNCWSVFLGNLEPRRRILSVLRLIQG